MKRPDWLIDKLITSMELTEKNINQSILTISKLEEIIRILEKRIDKLENKIGVENAN